MIQQSSSRTPGSMRSRLLNITSLKTIARQFVRRRSCWAIGIYTGSSPFQMAPHPKIKNPVLTAHQVTDVVAEGVADPFMVYDQGIWYMFFEVIDTFNGKGKIGFATSSDGVRWTYQQIVLDEPFHLSYPCVFKWNDDYYMVPESAQSKSVRLYKAIEFPTRWSLSATLLEDSSLVDPTLFQYDDRWWLFSSISGMSDQLRLHYTASLTDEWIEHPKSPIVKQNSAIARPSGRVLKYKDKLFRYTQDCEQVYGRQVRAFEITELTTTHYQEKEVGENPILKASGMGWNKTGMHHLDPHQINEETWIACVDGKSHELCFHMGLDNSGKVKD